MSLPSPEPPTPSIKSVVYMLYVLSHIVYVCFNLLLSSVSCFQLSRHYDISFGGIHVFNFCYFLIARCESFRERNRRVSSICSAVE